jgi:hypothetical protein
MVGILKLLQAGGIRAILLNEFADCPRVLRTAMDHFLFAVPLDLLHDPRRGRQRGKRQQADEQCQNQQHVPPLGHAAPGPVLEIAEIHAAIRVLSGFTDC